MAHWAACFCCLLLLFCSILIHLISAFSVFWLALSVAGSTAAAPSRVAECLLCTQNAVFFSCWWLEWISERALGSPPLCVSSVQVKQVCVLHWTFGSSYFTLTGISPSSCALWTYVQHHRVQGLNFLFLLATFEFIFFWLALQSRGRSTLVQWCSGRQQATQDDSGLPNKTTHCFLGFLQPTDCV